MWEQWRYGTISNVEIQIKKKFIHNCDFKILLEYYSVRYIRYDCISHWKPMWTTLKKDEYQRLNHVQFITLTPFITCESTVHVAFNRTP